MKRYAILAGGGVKGVALAGCLAAAQDKGIVFEGYGGTSAGSIVALLASAGYSGREIRDRMAEKNFTTFLDDGGGELDRVQRLLRKVFEGVSLMGALRTARAVYGERGLLRKLYVKSGLYRAGNLEGFLLESVRGRYPKLEKGFDFKNLLDAGAKPLKIVAADVVSRKSEVFSRDPDGDARDWSVIEAVRASTSYPLVFEPVKLNNNYLADGGISSNLPVFLFEKERKRNGLPVMAFDLVATPEDGAASEYSLFDFVRDMVMTMMESSDKLLQGLVSGLHYIPVKVPAGINTLKFALSKDEQEALFNAGYVAAAAYLDNDVKHWFERSGNRVEELKALQRTRPDAIEGVLAVVAKQWEERTRARGVRCSIVLPTGSDTQVVVYHYGMGGHTDEALEIDLESGWSGQARRWRDVRVADLMDDPQSFREEWKLTPAEHAKIPADRKAALCLPLFDVSGSLDGKIDPRNDRLVGTLCIDTSTPLGETGWGQPSAIREGEFVLSEVVREMCLLWGQVFSKLLS